MTAVEKDLVSWLRRDGPVPVLLTVGFLTHSWDTRFSVDFLPPRDYRLRVSNVGWHDVGIYLCQLVVHPPSLIWARIELEPPIVHLLDSEGSPVRELHYDTGTTVEMMCRIKRPPLQGPFAVEWESRTKSAPGKVHSLHRDVERGGVKVDTGLDEISGYLISRISLASARVSDAGNYTCRLGGVPRDVLSRYPRGLEDTIVVHVLKGEITKAIHSSAPPTGLARSGKTRLKLPLYVCVLLAATTSKWIATAAAAAASS